MGRKRCQICRSRKWHRDASSGVIVCSEGHVLKDVVDESHEAGATINVSALKGRYPKAHTNKDDEDDDNNNFQVYRGRKARYLYFQAAQLVLRYQIASLIKEWQLPPEFETVCRDFWALHLSFLPSPPPAEPIRFAGEMEMRHSKPPGDLGSERASQSRSKLNAKIEDKTETSSDEADEFDDNDLLSEDDEAHPSESETDAQTRNRWQGPIANIAILVLASWEMRLPVIYMDFIRLIESNKLPYISAISLLPPAMTVHMNPGTRKSLTPASPPSTRDLHLYAKRLARNIHLEHAIAVPELNAAPVLWRAVRALLGTPYIYKLTKRLASKLDIPLTLQALMSRSLETESDERTKYGEQRLPELALISVVIIVMKLVYNLNEDKDLRSRKDPNDPLFLMPEKEKWLEQLRMHHDARCSTTEELLAASSSLQGLSPAQLSEQQIDDLMSYAEQAFIPPAKAPMSSRANPNIDPLEKFYRLSQGAFSQQYDKDTPVPESPFMSTSSTHQSPNLFPPTPSPSFTSAPPQSQHPGFYLDYFIYSPADVTGTFPAPYQLVLDVAARWAGVSAEDVNTVVSKYERRILKSRRKKGDVVDDLGGDENGLLGQKVEA